MARKWSYSSYGRTAIRQSFTMPDFEKFLDTLAGAGVAAHEAAPKILNDVADQIVTDMKAGAEGHRRTGDVFDAIKKGPVVYDRGVYTIAVGIDLEEHPEAIEAVFQEYGDGHSPGFPDPFVRPAIERGQKRFGVLTRNQLSLKKLMTGKPKTHMNNFEKLLQAGRDYMKNGGGER